MFPALTPMNMSAPTIPSAILPTKSFGLQLSMNHCRIGSLVTVPLLIEPLESKAIMFFAPLMLSKRAIAVPAAPAPLITILQSAMFFFTNFNVNNFYVTSI